VVERAPMASLLDDPRHPYTVGLLASSVEVGGRELALRPIPGSPPDLARRPSGCAFHPRCPRAELPRCQVEQEILSIGPGRDAACSKVTVDA
jgi:oligopeptide/dipeptide ABC transporter ATP-binding protein